MIDISLKNKIDQAEFKKINEKLNSRNQGWLNVDTQIATNKKAVEDLFDSGVNKFIEHIVIIGIGGSMLGPKCVIECLKTRRDNDIKVHYCENSDPDLIHYIHSQLDYGRTLFFIQTKSGGTVETIAAFSYFRNKCIENKIELKRAFVFVTDPENGYLRQLAEKEGFLSLPVPADIGGRFSVITPIGMAVSQLSGLGEDYILDGYKSVLDNQREDAYLLAKEIVAQYHLGAPILVVFPYSTFLSTFAQWSVQLISESTGKELDLDDNKVNVGITPLPAVGATDQHSQLQLFAQGPKNKQVLFINIRQFDNEINIDTTNLPKDFDYVKNNTFQDLIHAQKAGTEASLEEAGLTTYTIDIDRLNEYSMGQLFGLFMLMTGYIGEMLNINTYDQPGVERSKVLTKEILGKE